jgi:hypothetical protein
MKLVEEQVNERIMEHTKRPQPPKELVALHILMGLVTLDETRIRSLIERKLNRIFT